MTESNMTDSEFLELAENTFIKLSENLENRFSELDTFTEGRVLNLEMDSGVKVVLNIQEAMRQIWLASPLGGFRYDLVEGSDWRNTKTGTLLLEDVLKALGANK